MRRNSNGLRLLYCLHNGTILPQICKIVPSWIRKSVGQSEDIAVEAFFLHKVLKWKIIQRHEYLESTLCKGTILLYTEM